MLRSRVGRLYRGAGKASSPASGLSGSNPGYAAPRRARPSSPPTSSTFLARLASSISAAAFRSESFFNASQPDLRHGLSRSPARGNHTQQLQSERYLPPLLDNTTVVHNYKQQALCIAIKNLDADYSWKLYQQLGQSRHALDPALIDHLITLQCRKPVRSLSGSRADAQGALRQVCDRILQLCKDKTRCQVGSSATSSVSADEQGLSTLSPELALRLLYLLIVEEEQIAASRSAHRRPHLSRTLQTLWAKLESRPAFVEQHIDIGLRGRLAATWSRLGSLDAAYRQLETVVHLSRESGDNLSVDPRPFDQLLIAVARQGPNSKRTTKYLPSPIDSPISMPDENDPIIRALRLAVISEVPVSKANIHKCLQALESPTLWWLLPFELDTDKTPRLGSPEIPDDRYPFKSRWHPWQTLAHEKVVPQDVLDTFAERVSLVLAQRGVLKPALHILAVLQPDLASDANSAPTSRTPDHDFFTVILEQLARRMSSNNDATARKSVDVHASLTFDLRLAVKIYSIAYTQNVDLDPRINEAVIRSFAACLPSSVVDIGSDRARITKFKAHIAERNQARGSAKLLQSYLRRFTDMVLEKDPDLSKGSLSYPSQATLLGLHLRVRDHFFSKRIYQLIRLREPDRELWSTDCKSGSLQHVAQHPACRPDGGTFAWLFGESLTATPKPYFAIQLSLDWLASGNVLPTGLMVLFVQTLLRADLTAEFRRVLQELQRSGRPLAPRLARGLVASLAEAGYPDLALEMVNTVSQAAASTAQHRSADVPTVGSSPEAGSSVLISALHLMSLALDRSSKALDIGEVRLVEKVLSLFDEYRLGLTQYLLRTQTEGDRAFDSSGRVAPQDVRAAYNAAMRVRLAALQSASFADTSDMEQEEFARLQDRASVYRHVEALFEEMTAQEVEPDIHSWTLRITASLYDCLDASSHGDRVIRLRRTLELYEHTLHQTFRADAPGSSREHAPQTIDPIVVTALIHACRRCSDLDAGLRVYETSTGQIGFDQNVEEAKLLLLAALGRRGEWQRELDRLEYADGHAFRLSQQLSKQLQALAAST